MSRHISRSFLLLAVLANVAWGQDKVKEKPYLVLDAGGHTAQIMKALFTPDGKQIISYSNDKTIRIWSVSSGELVRVLRTPIGPGREGILYAGDITPDGKILAVGGITPAPGGKLDTIYLIQLATGRIEKLLHGHTSGISSLQFSPDGKLLASGSFDRTARLWDWRMGHCTHVLQGHTDGVKQICFSPDSRQLATASTDRTARIWSVASGESTAVLQEHTGELFTIRWSPDGSTLATGGLDKMLRLWDAQGKLIKTFNKSPNDIWGLAFTPDSRRLLITTARGATRPCIVMDIATGKALATFTRHTGNVPGAAISPDGTLAATSGVYGDELFLWKLQDASLLHRLCGRGRATLSAAWSPDSQTVAWGQTFQNAKYNHNSPLERAFRLADLEMVDPQEAFTRARTERNDLKLTVTKSETLHAKKGNVELSSWKSPGFFNSIHCYTLMSAKHAVVGTNFGLYLVDIQAGKAERRFEGHTGTHNAVSPSPDGRYFLTGSNDQTLRIWSPQSKEPLVSLFAAGQEWVAWTPQGYYAASPGGEQLMGWHVNNGHDQMASFYPAAQFRKSLYRPDVIKLLLKAGSVQRALEIADATRGKKTEPTEVADVLPPRIRFMAPEKSATISVNKLEVRARATSAGTSPVTALQLLMDGRPVQGPTGLVRVASPKLGDVEASWNITLTPGKHRLTVRAESAVSSGLSDEVEMTYVVPEPIKLPNLYILTIGISDYAGGLKLNYAAKDAHTLAKAFQDYSKPLFEKIEVKELTNQKATQREILKGIAWLSKQMTQRDVGIVFLAGHGEMAGNGAFYFLPADVDPDEITATGVHGEQLKTMLVAMPGRVIFLLDACHAGGVNKTKKRAASALTDDLIRDLATDEHGIIVMSAATGRQFALESEEHHQGLFTLALVEGLQGKAKRVEGAVYLNQLDVYVTDRVRELSRGQQSPTTARPASIRSFPLSQPR